MAVEVGDSVQIRYVGWLDSGEVFDSNLEDEDPLTVRIGSETLLPSFEEKIVGMEKGQKKTFRLSPEEAYGPKRMDLVQSFDRDLFEDPDELVPQSEVELEDEEGNVYTAEVVEMDEETVTLNLNHPLAGEALNFEVEVVEIFKEKGPHRR